MPLFYAFLLVLPLKHFQYAGFSILLTNCKVFGKSFAPTKRPASFPVLKSITVGIDCTYNQKAC